MKARELIKFSLNPRLIENPALPIGYIRNAYYNGVGRYVCQLQRLTIKFCKNHKTSHGVRDFVETKLLDFSRKNPGVVIYMKPRLHKTPVIVADYLNGESRWMSVYNFSANELDWWLDFMRTRSGYKLTQLISQNNVLVPSAQGLWNPFLNRPTDLIGKRFPVEERNIFSPSVPSATDKLLDLVNKYKLAAS